MKKILFLSLFLVVAAAFGFSSCGDDDDPSFLGANVTVKVTNALGVVQSGKTVYMYKDSPVTEATVPGDAKKMAVTDDNGIAKFSLNLTELNILESQTNLYFAVFYTLADKTAVAGTEGVTVKRNESKELEIKIPL
ncbi:hypothetical protein CLV62_101274 [Dysgonomonas alginatilytica]|uniref:Uncharacterized protein n=1 Tax=Dysgonomonas alginatilytica TaxID=1605892 RepID=A0A2V3PTE6_9BACT|nr:hypothetical protein [Dysgonomonas alginatilytica]PXV69007.1 hypothetical protein CLV62_101274 [Dysgonomonas alginatilytica]